MPLIWCSISGHGFGHAAQVVPVLNVLGARDSSLKAILRTTVPASFFSDRLSIDWELNPAQQDIGCIQDGPLKIDMPATWSAHQRFHEQWEDTVQEEARAIRISRANLVLSDISHLAIEAGAVAQVPTIALGSLSWDRVLELLHEPGDEGQHAVIQQIRQSYALADALLRIAPGLPMPSFRKITDVAPIAQPASSERTKVREMLGVDPQERLVLVGFGGIPLRSLPLDRMESMTGYRFLVDGAISSSYSRIHSIHPLPFRFGTLIASVDLLITKPGYATIVEAVAQQKPVIYVRRYNFADEEPLIGYLHRYGQGVELALPDLNAGRWEDALEQTWTEPLPSHTPPAPSGAQEAAAVLREYLERPVESGMVRDAR